MKISRDIGASELICAMRVLGYESVPQDGSHIRLIPTLGETHHLRIPNHRPLLGGVLNPVAAHHKLSVDELLAKLEL